MYLDENPQGKPQERGRESGSAPKYAKLSDAIRAGCALDKPNDGATFFLGGTCAVGAAHDAIFGKENRQLFPNERVREHFGYSSHEWHGTMTVSTRYSACLSREKVADELAALGY